jgi:hypothetical protein
MTEQDTVAPAQPTPLTTPASWAIIELYGHRKIGGRITEVVIAGKSFVQVDVPTKDDGFAPSVYNPNSFFGFHPVSEEIARAFAKRNPFRPVEDYEIGLPNPQRALPGMIGDHRDIDDDDSDDDGGTDDGIDYETR